jgi:anaerobilin synthase
MNLETRYRSHHDSENAIRTILGITKRHPGVNIPGFMQLLDMEPGKSRRGAYLHVPYCDRICTFCNMNRKEMTRRLLADYSKELESQLIAVRDAKFVRGKPFESIYFGGGTPTIFSTEEYWRLLSGIRDTLPMTADCEWSVETTIHNATDEKIELMSAAGVNRLSIGVQTFSDRGRRVLGRYGSGAYVARRLEAIRSRFKGTIGIDIIYSYPEQTQEEIDKDVAYIRSLGLDSVSFYSLMLHEGSQLHTEIESGRRSFNRSVDEDRLLHHRFLESMYAGGYELLELTKLVRPGRDEYRYIRLRYDGGDLLPLGNGAGGSMGAYSVYRMSGERIMVSPIDPRFDGFHRVLGHLQFGRYDVDALAGLCGAGTGFWIESLLHEYEVDGFLQHRGGTTWSLTPEGVFWGNNLAVDFIAHAVREMDLDSMAERIGESDDFPRLMGAS